MYTRLFLFAAVLACSLAGRSIALADSPAAEIKATVDRVIQILTDHRYEGEARKPERRRLLRETIFPRFDFQEMAKRSLGPEWNRRNPEEQRAFVRLFTEFVEQTYIRRIESYTNEKFIYTGERIDEPYAEVDSKLVTSKGEEITITYLLHRVAADWKVYELIVDDVSLVNNYRSQFNRVIRKSSYEGLVRRIEEKVEDMAQD